MQPRGRPRFARPRPRMAAPGAAKTVKGPGNIASPSLGPRGAPRMAVANSARTNQNAPGGPPSVKNIGSSMNNMSLKPNGVNPRPRGFAPRPAVRPIAPNASAAPVSNAANPPAASTGFAPANQSRQGPSSGPRPAARFPAPRGAARGPQSRFARPTGKPLSGSKHIAPGFRSVGETRFNDSGPGVAPQMQQMPRGRRDSRAGQGHFQHPKVGNTHHQERPMSNTTQKAEIEFERSCASVYQDLTVGVFPNTSLAAKQSSIPLGVVVHPLAEADEGVPVVNFGNTGIVRCDKCRAYINPFVNWIDNGRSWQCNICGKANPCHSEYYSHLDEKGLRADRDSRPELNKGCVDIIATQEYTVRPPMPPVYLFCLETTAEARSSGMLSVAIQTIKKTLDKLPGNPRTRIGFLTFDQTIQFYNLRKDLTRPQIFTVSDLTDIFLPVPEDLLVNLADSREVVDTLLDTLLVSLSKPSQQPGQPNTNGSCLGSALLAALNVMAYIGGKCCLFASSLPKYGNGTLAERYNTQVLGSPTEHHLLNPPNEMQYYTKQAADMVKYQVSVDIFAFPPFVQNSQHNYMDLASLSGVTTLTAGDIKYYNILHFGTPNSALEKFEKDLTRSLTQTTGWESVMRVRASYGLVIKAVYGKTSVRTGDLMALPVVAADSAFAVEFDFETTKNGKNGVQTKDLMGMAGDTLSQAVSVQTALLYTNSEGERRIRVFTSCVPLSSQVIDVITSARCAPVVNLLCKKGIELCKRGGFADLRQKLEVKCGEVVRAYRANQTARKSSASAGQPMQPGARPTPPGGTTTGNMQSALPDNLREFPLLMLGMIKSKLFKGGNTTTLDERVGLMSAFLGAPSALTDRLCLPKMFSITQESSIQSVPLSGSSVNQTQVLVLDNGIDILIWVGSSCPPGVAKTLFGVPDVKGKNEDELRLLLLEMMLKSAETGTDNCMKQLREYFATSREACPGSSIQVVPAGSRGETYFAEFMVEDKQDYSGGTMSTQQFLHSVMSQSQPTYARR